MKTKKLLLNALPLLLIGTAMVYAAAPSGGYLPGATTDPACAPGDTDCVVQVPVAEDELPVTGSGVLIKTSDGSVIWGEVKGSSPVGTVSWFAGANAPAGWFIANGSTISRTTYADLYAVIGETYGAGDGTSTFTLPDLRGEFVRGIDSGRGVDAGRILGSNQNASKVLKSVTTQGGSYSEGAFAGARYQADINLSSNLENTTSTDTNSTSDATGGGSINTRNTFGEVRPRNIAMTPIIKWALPAGDTNVSDGASGTDNQTLTLSGSNLSIRDGNMVNLSGLSGTNIWSQTGSTTYYNNGKVGIGTTTPDSTLHLSADSGTPVKTTYGYSGGSGNARKLYIKAHDDGAGENVISIGRRVSIDTADDEVLTVSGNGNVGIGTTEPNERLDVSGNILLSGANARRIYSMETSRGSIEISYPHIASAVGIDRPVAYGNNLYIDSSGTLQKTSDATGGSALIMGAQNGGTGGFHFFGLTDTDNSTVTTSEFMTIIGNGNVGIGRTNPSYKLHVNGSVAGVGAYVNTSDRRLKQDFENLENPLEKLLKIKGLTFDWKRDENPEMDFPQGRDLGVVAQDVEKVFPEAVVQDDDGIFSVAYSKLIAPIIEAIRELVFENERQDAEIKKLMERIEQLENK